MTFIRSLITVSLFLAFIGLWIWAWRAERHADFADAARIPLEPDSDADQEHAP